MKKSKFLFCILIFPIVIHAQIDSLRIRDFPKKCWSDTKSIITAPTNWDGRDWGTLAALTATTAALFLVDDPVQDAFQSIRLYGGSKGANFSTHVLEPWGGKYSLLAIGGFVGYGLITKNEKSKTTGMLAIESFALAGILVQIQKRLIGRSRPDSEPDISPYIFKGPLQETSLPSGHTTVAFAVASVFANQYADTGWVPILSYSIASVSGLSRIYDNRHWLSDVVAGAALGIVVGNLVCQKKNKEKRIALVPLINGEFKGLKLALTL